MRSTRPKLISIAQRSLLIEGRRKLTSRVGAEIASGHARAMSTTGPTGLGFNVDHLPGPKTRRKRGPTERRLLVGNILSHPVG